MTQLLELRCVDETALCNAMEGICEQILLNLLSCRCTAARRACQGAATPTIAAGDRRVAPSHTLGWPVTTLQEPSSLQHSKWHSRDCSICSMAERQQCCWNAALACERASTPTCGMPCHSLARSRRTSLRRAAGQGSCRPHCTGTSECAAQCCGCRHELKAACGSTAPAGMHAIFRSHCPANFAGSTAPSPQPMRSLLLGRCARQLVTWRKLWQDSPAPGPSGQSQRRCPIVFIDV